MPSTTRYLRWLALAIAAGLAAAAAGQEPQPAKVLRDLEYARVGDVALQLDLYLPAERKSPPVVVWVHGGAWRSGSKENCPLVALTERGLAVASVDYRLSPVAKFPAQIYDLKAAIRYLRGTASKHGLGADRIAIAGASAGGHLAALVGVTNGHHELEGTIGQHGSQSSDVQAIVSLYGPTNLTSILDQSTPHGLKVRVPALELLLGGQPEAQAELARLASPVFHVDAKDPRLLMLHGDQDPQVPINQSHELDGAYEKAGLQTTLEVVHGGAHGGEEFYSRERMSKIAEFLAPCLAPPQPGR